MALLLLTGAVASGATLRGDATALSWFTSLDDGGASHVVARILVMGGQFWLAGSVLALLAAFQGWVQRSLRPVLVAGVSMAGLEAVVWALKALTGRTAPASGVNAVLAGGSSFPSGLGSQAVVADSTQTLLCTYLSGVLLLGLALNATLGWWWADPVVGLAIAGVAANEGREAWRGEGCCAPSGGGDDDPGCCSSGGTRTEESR